MAKLLITRIDKRETSNPLSIIFDSAQKHIFKIGRDIGNAEADTLDFVVSDKHVSRLHCYIEFESVNDSERWFIRDISSNGTIYNGVKLDYNVRQKLTGFEDTIVCSPSGAGFVVDSTVTDPGDFIPADDSEPTINETINAALAQVEASESKTIDKPWYADLVKIIVDGPKGFPQWLWWLCLLGGGLFVAWLRHQAD
jgi:pSer/pThr/pTyr-binding forkhead associated (FHA) protein